jgi:hypothetical protein
MQSPDYVYYQNKKYYLIDISNGRKLFRKEDYADINTEVIVLQSTGNYRGYEIRLKIRENHLYMIRYNESKVNKKLCFSGSIIIVREEKDHYNTDFLSSVFLFKEVKELIFKEGALVDVNNISKQLDDYEQTESENDEWTQKPKEEYVDSICVGDFKGSTYKWR